MGLEHHSRRSDLDIALISSTWSHMQEKTSRLERNAARTYVDLKLSVKKTKVIHVDKCKKTGLHQDLRIRDRRY